MKSGFLQIRRALRSVLLILLLSAGGMGKMYAVTIGDLNYDLNNNTLTATVTGHKNGTAATGSLTIPSSVTYTSQEYVNGQYVPVTRTYSVTSIGNYAFYKCSGLSGSLIIPNSVTTIGEFAFYTCHGFTGSLIIPNSVTTIGHHAFECSGFTGNLVIPDFVTTIGGYAFSGCSGFTESLTIPNSVTTIYDGAFSGCSGFNGSLTIGNSVITIGYGAFSNCTGLTGNLVIPNSVTTIGGGAFSSCTGFNGSLTIGNSVTTIGGSAFSGCSGFNGSLTIGNSVTSIGYRAFQDCSGFTGNLTIPNSVTTIGETAFSGCSGLDGDLIIGDSVTRIERATFYNCGFTGDLYIGNSVNFVDEGNNPFIGFTGTLTIGQSLLYLPSVFKYQQFSHIVVALGNTQFDSRGNCNAIIGTSTNTLLKGCKNTTIPNSVTTIGEYALSGCTGLTSITIPNSVTTIGKGAFLNCTGLTGELFIPNSVMMIEGCDDEYWWEDNGAFQNCSGLTSLVLGNSLTKIGGLAFSDCTGLTGDLTIPNSVTTIGNDAFSGCSGFNGSLTIGNSVTTIGNYAFSYCSGFNGSLTIGNSVTSIGDEAFWDCNGFTELYYNAMNCVDAEYCSLGGNFILVVLGEEVESLPNYGMFSSNSLQFLKSNAVVPPSVGGSSTFDGINRNTPIIVPCGTLEAYQAAPYWSEFTNIRESEFSLVVKANPEYLGSAIIVQEPDCNSSHASVSAIPNLGCRFINWTCNGEVVSQSRNYSFDMEEDMVLTANFAAHKRFVHTVSMLWSDPNNWEPNGVPADTMSVDILSDVVIDSDVTVGSLFIHGGHVLTIMPNATLTVTETLEVQQNSYWDYYIVIEDGGQLIHPNENVYATVKKIAKAQSETSDNWELIACPLKGWKSISAIQNILSNEYDLFYYNEPTQYWINKKQSNNHFNSLEAGSGYLFANSGIVSPAGSQIGEGTGTIFDFWNNSNISEILFRSNELAMEGLSTEPLGELYWYATEDAYISEQSNISIWMANVSDNVLTETSHITSDMTLVYSGNMTITPGWNEFVFNEGNFAWDGTSNVLICVQRNNGEWWDNMSWRSHEADFVAVSYDYTYDEYDMSSQTYFMSTSNMRPNTMFVTVGQLGTSEYHPVTLSFSGQLQSGTATVSLPLSYTEGIEHPGFNLVGNPYVHNVTSYASENVAEGCYRMNEAQDEIIVSEISEANPLKPAEGFFVKALAEGASITFNPERKDVKATTGSICVEIAENGQTLDRIILKRGSLGLEKLSLNENSTKLFAVKGQQEMAIAPMESNQQTVCFKAAKNGTYTIIVNVEDMNLDYLHLIDKLAGTDIDLLTSLSYSFEAKTNDALNRFALLFDENALFEEVGTEGSRDLIPILPPHGSDINEPAWPQTFTQEIAFITGSNWFSTYVDISLEDLQNALVEALPGATSITIKGRTQSSFYNGTRWRGALSSLDLALMYQITVPESCEITLEGMPIDPAQHPVTIKNGPNWIGFPFSESMTLDEAFPGFPVSGDKIQSKSDGQATYSNRWRGALNALVPGQGYIYQSNSAEDRVFTFPTGAK